MKRRLTRRDRVWRLLLRPVAVDRGHKPLSKKERGAPLGDPSNASAAATDEGGRGRQTAAAAAGIPT